MGNENLRSYLRIATPDGEHFIWINRPDREGRTYFICNFDMDTGFADELDGLGYITVESISRLVAGMCTIVVQFNRDATECLNHLLDDLPGIMDRMDFGNPLIPDKP